MQASPWHIQFSYRRLQGFKILLVRKTSALQKLKEFVQELEYTLTVLPIALFTYVLMCKQWDLSASEIYFIFCCISPLLCIKTILNKWGDDFQLFCTGLVLVKNRCKFIAAWQEASLVAALYLWAMWKKNTFLTGIQKKKIAKEKYILIMYLLIYTLISLLESVVF